MSQFGLTLTQFKYASNVLHRFHMENAKPTKTPCCPSVRLVTYDGVSLFDPIEYRNMVGALQYLTFTRPDLAFSVHQLCQFLNPPTTTHLEATKCVLRYIHGTLYHGITFTPGPLSLTAFSNANWVRDPSYPHSISGLLVFLGPLRNSPLFHALPLRLNTMPWPPLLLRYLSFASSLRSWESFFPTYLSFPHTFLMV